MKLHALLRSALFGFALAIAVSLHAASVIKLEFTQYEVRENEATVVIGVLRGGEVGQAGTVDYATASLAATAGTDFEETAGTLAFAPGETLKLVSIPVLNDALKEPKETFRFALSNPTGGGVVGTPKTATVTVLDKLQGRNRGSTPLASTFFRQAVFQAFGEVAAFRFGFGQVEGFAKMLRGAG